MPLRLTSAPVAGVQKKRKLTGSRGGRSLFANHARTKASAVGTGGPAKGDGRQGKKEGREEEEDEEEGEGGMAMELPDLGLSKYIPQTTAAQNVPQAIRCIQTSMFDELPASRSGMSSARVAEVLRFRRALPPLASVAHVHTLLDAPTKTEREIVELLAAGVVRRVVVPGRDGDAASVGDCLVLTEVWEGMVKASTALGGGLKNKFLQVLKRIGSSSAIPPGVFMPDEYRALVRAGFVVSASSLAKGTLPNLPASTATPASRVDQSTPPEPPATENRFETTTLYLSLPNTGPYLRLLSATRAHLLALLSKSHSRSVPLSLLQDKWDGAVESPDKSFHAAKRARGEYAGLLPGRTKKWKDLCGVRLRWVLESCLGAGLVEVFDTGSVGAGVRAV